MDRSNFIEMKKKKHHHHNHESLKQSLNYFITANWKYFFPQNWPFLLLWSFFALVFFPINSEFGVHLWYKHVFYLPGFAFLSVQIALAQAIVVMA